MLTGFPREDFGSNERNRIAQYLTPSVVHLNQVVRLAGYLDVGSLQLQQLSSSAELSAYERFAVLLAQARMGEQAAVTALTAKLATIEVNDDFVYEIVPDLVYTRQKELYDFLITIIRDERKNCLSANPNSESRILCGYRVMEYMAPVVADYPLPVDELDIRNYRQALAEVRDWFAANPDYTIKDNSF